MINWHFSGSNSTSGSGGGADPSAASSGGGANNSAWATTPKTEPPSPPRSFINFEPHNIVTAGGLTPTTTDHLIHQSAAAGLGPSAAAAAMLQPVGGGPGPTSAPRHFGFVPYAAQAYEPSASAAAMASGLVPNPDPFHLQVDCWPQPSWRPTPLSSSPIGVDSVTSGGETSSAEHRSFTYSPFNGVV